MPSRPRAERSTPDITSLLTAWSAGDRHALDDLVAVVHRELRMLARRAMLREGRDHTLQPSALVNEVYLRLVEMHDLSWTDRAHFFALAGRLMRRILIDLARAKRVDKRGGGLRQVTWIDDLPASVPRVHHDLDALDEALTRLAAIDPRRAQVVELRFFGGLSVDEVAAVLKVSPRTVMRDWTLARAWLFREVRSEGVDNISG
jgi:RNA polymerase sigma-70 factor, ECF subfamily